MNLFKRFKRNQPTDVEPVESDSNEADSTETKEMSNDTSGFTEEERQYFDRWMTAGLKITQIVEQANKDKRLNDGRLYTRGSLLPLKGFLYIPHYRPGEGMTKGEWQRIERLLISTTGNGDEYDIQEKSRSGKSTVHIIALDFNDFEGESEYEDEDWAINHYCLSLETVKALKELQVELQTVFDEVSSNEQVFFYIVTDYSILLSSYFSDDAEVRADIPEHTTSADWDMFPPRNEVKPPFNQIVFAWNPWLSDAQNIEAEQYVKERFSNHPFETHRDTKKEDFPIQVKHNVSGDIHWREPYPTWYTPKEGECFAAVQNKYLVNDRSIDVCKAVEFQIYLKVPGAHSFYLETHGY